MLEAKRIVHRVAAHKQLHVAKVQTNLVARIRKQELQTARTLLIGDSHLHVDKVHKPSVAC